MTEKIMEKILIYAKQNEFDFDKWAGTHMLLEKNPRKMITANGYLLLLLKNPEFIFSIFGVSEIEDKRDGKASIDEIERMLISKFR